MVRTGLMAFAVCALLISLSPPALAQATQPAADPPLAGATVAVPWKELARLLDDGNRAARPPVDIVFAPAAYTAKPAGDAIEVVAQVDVTMLREGYALVPVAAENVAVESVTIDNQPAPLVVKGRSLSALVNGAGKKSLRVTLKRPIVSHDGAHHVELPLADWPISTLELTVPEPVVMTAVNAASSTSAIGDGTTTLTATYSGGTVAAISWRPRPVADAANHARLYGQSQTRVSIRRGLMRYTTSLDLEIERGAIESLQITIDLKAVVLSVAGTQIARHQEQPPAAGAKGKAVTLTFARPVTGRQKLELVYEKDLPEAGGAADVVAPKIADARRDGGLLAIDADGTYEVRPATADGDKAAENADAAALRRISVSELPEGLRSDATTLAYRYAIPGGVAITLTPVKPLPPKVIALTQTRVAVDRGVVRCQATVSYEILHAGVDSFRIALPAGAELVSVDGDGIRDKQVIEEGGGRTLVVGLKDVARKAYALTVSYDVLFGEKQAAAATKPGVTNPAAATKPATQPANAAPAAAMASVTVPLIAHPDAAKSTGYVGIEVRGGYEISTTVTGGERVDVKELPRSLWSLSRSPMLEGYRYDEKPPALSLSLRRHEDLDVLVAMSDVCEAATTITADGRTVTKLMYVVRNNLKPHMTLQLPAGAQVWSTFVDDRPVTPSRTADGRVLIPLRRSEEVDEHDRDSYQSRRDQRRKGDERVRLMEQVKELRADEPAATDLKPYDVEVVYVMPSVKLDDRGELELALPQSDVPVGHLAWAVFMPKQLRVLEARGNVSEVSRFTLGFRHFGDAAIAQAQQAQEKLMVQNQMQQLAQQMEDIAQKSKVAGVLPVRVEIPIAGEITRLEKLLVVDEMPKVTISYGRRID